MSAVFIRRISNLSKLVGEKGGKTVLAALRAAETETAPLREEGRALLAEAVTALETAAGDPWGETWLDDVYRASAAIIDICPPDLPAVAKAAWSLCDLVDHQRRTGVDAPPIAVHVAAVRTLCHPGMDATTAAPLLTGLEALLAREVARGG